MEHFKEYVYVTGAAFVLAETERRILPAMYQKVRSFKRPFWIARDILSDHRYLSYHLQRMVLNPASRRKWARRLARFLPKSQRINSDEQTGRIVSGLQSVGFFELPNLVTPEEVREMRAHFEKTLCQDRYRPQLGTFLPGVNAPAETHIASPEPIDIIRAPHALKVANNPAILAAMEQRFGCKPTIAFVHAWWSLKGHQDGEEAELFHRDLDDWDFIKLFVYLTDVDENSGPHVYMVGSATTPKCNEIRRYREEDIYDAFGLEKRKIWKGSAGTAFLEDTFGFHRGLPARNANRLIFQVVYTVKPIPTTSKTTLLKMSDIQCPVLLDPYINRLYIK